MTRRNLIHRIEDILIYSGLMAYLLGFMFCLLGWFTLDVRYFCAAGILESFLLIVFLLQILLNKTIRP